MVKGAQAASQTRDMNGELSRGNIVLSGQERFLRTSLPPCVVAVIHNDTNNGGEHKKQHQRQCDPHSKHAL